MPNVHIPIYNTTTLYDYLQRDYDLHSIYLLLLPTITVAEFSQILVRLPLRLKCLQS